jgi:hypothetical protein
MMKNNTSLFSPKNPFLSPMFLPSLSLFHYHLIQVNVMMLQLSMRIGDAERNARVLVGEVAQSALK